MRQIQMPPTSGAAIPRFTRGDGIALAVSLAALTLLITQGTLHFATQERLSSAWDSLAANLLKLDGSVSEASIEWEGTVRNGKHYIPNYGPFPGIVRILPNLLFPSMYGKWARASCLVAAALALLAFAWITRRALDDNSRLEAATRDRLSVASILGFALGTPLFFLMCNGRIYHETMLWGLSSAMITTCVLLEVLNGNARTFRGLCLLSAATGITLLSRITFGFIFAGLTGGITLLWLADRLPTAGVGDRVKLRWSRALVAGLPLALGLAIQLWYNREKFGEPLRFYNYTGYFTDPSTYGGIYNLRRLPSLLSIYFGFTWRYFVPRFPYLQFARVHYSNPGLFYSWREEATSLWFGSSWLVCGALVGAWALWRDRHPLALVKRLCVAMLLAQVAGLLTHFLATERYEAELLPIFVFCYAYALKECRWRYFPRAIVPLVAFSCYVSASTTLQWTLFTNLDFPPAYQRALASFFYPKTFHHPDRFYRFRDEFDGYTTVDSLDIRDEVSEAAHRFEQHEVHRPQLLSFYESPNTPVVVEDQGRRIDHAVSWKVRNVRRDRSLYVIARYDGMGTSAYSLTVNGKLSPGELWLPQNAEGMPRWQEALAEIPGELLADGENAIELSHLAKSPSAGSAIYYLWFVQGPQPDRPSAPLTPTERIAGFSRPLTYAETVSLSQNGKSATGYAARLGLMGTAVSWLSGPASGPGAARLDFDGYIDGTPGAARLFVNHRPAVRFAIDRTETSGWWLGDRIALGYQRGKDGIAHFTVDLPPDTASTGKPITLSVMLDQGKIDTRFAVLGK